MSQRRPAISWHPINLRHDVVIVANPAGHPVWEVKTHHSASCKNWPTPGTTACASTSGIWDEGGKDRAIKLAASLAPGHNSRGENSYYSCFKPHMIVVNWILWVRRRKYWRRRIIHQTVPHLIIYCRTGLDSSDATIWKFSTISISRYNLHDSVSQFNMNYQYRLEVVRIPVYEFLS